MKRTVLLGLICIVVLPPLRSAQAQRSLSATENSYRQARRILDGGVQALGGLSALASAQNFSLKMSGQSYEIFSSQAPDPPFDKSSFTRSVYVDTSHHRIVAEEKISSTTFPYTWWTRDIANGADEYFINLQMKTVAHTANPEWAEYRNWLQLISYTILTEALERAATLRLIGHAVFQGRQQDVISFATAGGQAVTLYFDARTKLLTKHEYLYTRNASGDTSRAYVFTGYHDVGGMEVPGGRIGYNAGYLASEAAYTEIKFNQQPGESLFDLPAGLTTLQVVEPETTVNRLADDVYLLQSIPGGYNVLFVAFNGYVLVAEAPERDVRSGLSEQAIARIKETLPGKLNISLNDWPPPLF